MKKESLAEKRKRAEKILHILNPIYPKEKTALKHQDAFQLLIATILSAQCTDERVNMVTKELFKKYNSPEAFAQLPLETLEELIKPTGFYKNKAKAIKNCCLALLERFGGRVPSTMEEMLTLPGVGRKTANVVLGAVYGVPGIVVDTHVRRLARLLGFTDSEDPEKIEKDLEALLEPENWRRFSDVLIYHGRQICKARKPLHSQCPIRELCPSSGNP